MSNTKSIKEEAIRLKEENPGLRSRDLAEKMGISEAELISQNLDKNITILEGDWKELLSEVENMGRIMALSRNEYAVHERKGVYKNLKFFGGKANMGVAVNPDIDLRFFMNEWKYGIAITLDKPQGKLYGFQFFNKYGEAVHKIYSTPDSDLSAYHDIVKKYTAENQSPIHIVEEKPVEKEVFDIDSFDREAFQKAWKELKDTHDFYHMLRNHNIPRIDAMDHAPSGFTIELDKSSYIRAMELAVENNVPIMCFVHSPGIVQIHTGEIYNIREMRDWFNIMDKDFNLHLNQNGIDSVWLVRKPTEDGIVTSIEIFDKAGELITYFFGKRKPGIPELESWVAITDEIEKSHSNV